MGGQEAGITAFHSKRDIDLVLPGTKDQPGEPPFFLISQNHQWLHTVQSLPASSFSCNLLFYYQCPLGMLIYIRSTLWMTALNWGWGKGAYGPGGGEEGALIEIPKLI